MLGNHICDQPCLTPACSNDSGDCANQACSPDCYSYMLSNGVCEEPCRTAACGWDSSDCDCMLGCTPDLLGNSVCDNMCNFAECGFDNGKCGNCASGCFHGNIGNSQCDSQCNVESCAWDGFDCGCAPGCNTPDYGSCKAECLVASCLYDKMPTYPPCPEEAVRTSAMLYHLYFQDFSKPYSLDLCYSMSSCNPANWQSSQTMCLSNCNFPECGFSFINCGSPGDCPAICSACIEGNHTACLGCDDGYMQTFTSCSRYCPHGFEPNSMLPGICYPLKDESSANSPAVMYVTSQSNIDGNGTYANPYDSLAKALDAVHFKYTVIYALPGTHVLSPTSKTAFLNGWSEDISTKATKTIFNITIAGFLCELDPSASLNCLNVRPVLLLDNQNPVLLKVSGVLSFREVNISANSSLIPACEGRQCIYCASITVDALGNGVTDKGVYMKSGTFAPESACQPFLQRTFATLDPGATLTFTSLSILNFRQGYSSLFTLSAAFLTFTSVTFTNTTIGCKAPPSPGATTYIAVEAVIVQTVSGTAAYSEGLISMDNCTVELMNNGFEFNNGLAKGGFLSAKGLRTISIRNSTFRNCLIPSTMLINIGNTLVFSIDFTQFLTIYAGQNLIRLSPVNSPVTYQENVDSVISLTNAVFLQCSVLLPGNTYGSLFMAMFSTVFINLRMENVTISSSLAKVSAIYIYFPGTQLPQDKSGYTQIARNATSRTEINFPKKWARIKNVTIDSTVSSGLSVTGLVYLSGVINLELSNNLISNSADYDPSESINTKTFQYLIGTPGVYLSKLPPFQALTHCTKIITFQRIYNATCLRNTLINTKCLDNAGSAGIHSGGGMTGDFIVNGLVVDRLFGVVTSTATCLHIAATNDVFVSNLDIRNSIFTAAGCVRFASSISLTNSLNNSYFSNNTGPAAVCQAVISYSLNVTSVVFEDNVSSTQAGLYFQAAPGLTSVKLGIYSCGFNRNRGGVGTAVYIANSASPASPLSLTIRSCKFTGNQGTGSGSAIYIENTNPMASGTNSISRCTFQNAVSEKGVIGVAYMSGSLTINLCNFVNSTVSFGTEITGKIGQNAWAIAGMFQGTQSSLTFKVSNCVFQQGSGSSAIVFSSSNANATLTSTNNTFSDNASRAISLERGTLTDSKSTYTQNTGECFFAASEALVNVTSAVIQGNRGYFSGAMYLGGESKGYCDNCTVSNCSSLTAAGGMYVEQSSLLSVSNSHFKGNIAKTMGSAVSIFGSQAKNIIKNTIFENNLSTEGGTVSCLASSLSLTNSSFQANSAAFAPGVLLYLSSVTIVNSTFKHQTSAYGVFLYAAIQSFITVNNSLFEGSVANATGGAIFLISAQIAIYQTTFLNNSAYSAPILHSDSSSLILSSSSILNTVSNSADGMLIMSSGSCQVDSTLISNYTNGGFKLFSLTEVSFRHVKFAAGNSTQGGAIFTVDCHSVEVVYSEFLGLNASSGSGLYLSSDKGQQTVYLIDNCKFEGLIGETSGAIDLHQVNIIIHASSFRFCKAIGSDGQGGAVHSDCPYYQLLCRIQIEECNFEGNFASKQGGGISWFDSKPVLMGNLFADNSALYGPDVASFPVSIDVVMVTGNGTVEQLGEDESQVKVKGVLRGCGSGQIAEYTVLVDVLDHYSQQVSTENSLVAGISGAKTGTSVFGNATTQAISGRFSFSGFGITATPGQTTLIYISSSGIQQDSSQSAAIFALRVEMRECLIGESLVGIQCVVCPEGKYSLDPSVSCKQCLSEAICYGNYTMVPQSGYWRANMLTEVFWECPNHDACIGSPEPPLTLSYTGLCEDGYYGNLCNGCKSGFSRQNSIDCVSCPTFIVNVVKMVGIGVGVVLALVIIIKTSISSARKPRSQYSIFIKILLNYFQLVMLTASFSLQWPSYMKELFRVQETAGNVTDQVFSIDCFLDSKQEDSQASTVRLKVLAISFLPVIIFVGSLVIWLPVAILKRQRAILKNEMVATIVISFFLVHPSIVKFMFNFLNCRELTPGEYWMALYLNIKCWDYIHTRYALIVAVPSIVVWGIGTPLLCLLVMYQNKFRLQLLEMKLRLGFIYNGYEPSKYYWEFVILYRKIIIICLAVFLTNISIPVQALTVMMVLLAAFGLQVKHKPYVVTTMNALEVKAILVAAVTIYCGLYYMTKSVNAQSQLVLFVVVVAINAYFLLNWAYRVLEIGFKTALNYIPCLKRCFTRGSRMHVIKPAVTTALRSSDPNKPSLDMSQQLDDSEELHESRVGQFARSPASAMSVPDNSSVMNPE